MNIKPAKHLINLIDKTKDHHPNFTLLLGAGASVESGIKSGQQLIQQWRREYSEIHTAKNAAKLQEQRWYNQPEEYSVLFETLFDQPSLRRELIESLIKDANPSWGYVYLVNLIRENVFNTVSTTNFDDLLNEACYLFTTDVRPIVCSHDSSIRSIRVFSSRPKIIKLHGDFLFDSIKNTVRELENLEDNMREKFRQCAGEFGLIVLGYGGNDRSIMDTLDALLRNDDYFPHGIYWCVRGSDIPPRVDELQRFSNFHVININGLNDFFATLHSSLGLGAPIDDPYVAVKDRLRSLVTALPVPKPWETPGPSQLHQDIRAFCDSLMQANQDEFVTNEIRCNVYYKKGQFTDAARAIMAALHERESPSRSSQYLETAFRCCVESGDNGLFDEIVEEIKSDEELLNDSSLLIEGALVLIALESYDNARTVLGLIDCEPGRYTSNVVFVNLCQIKLHRGTKLRKPEKERLESLLEGGLEFWICCKILLGEAEAAVNKLITDPESSIGFRIRLAWDLKGWPIWKLLPTEVAKQIDEFIESDGKTGISK